MDVGEPPSGVIGIATSPGGLFLSATAAVTKRAGIAAPGIDYQPAGSEKLGRSVAEARRMGYSRNHLQRNRDLGVYNFRGTAQR